MRASWLSLNRSLADEWNEREQLNMYELRDAIHASGIDRLNTLFFHNCMMGLCPLSRCQLVPGAS